MWKNSVPKLREVIGETKTKIYCPRTVCRRCVLAALKTVKWGLTKVENQEKPLRDSEGNKSFFDI